MRISSSLPSGLIAGGIASQQTYSSKLVSATILEHRAHTTALPDMFNVHQVTSGRTLSDTSCDLTNTDYMPSQAFDRFAHRDSCHLACARTIYKLLMVFRASRTKLYRLPRPDTRTALVEKPSAISLRPNVARRNSLASSFKAKMFKAPPVDESHCFFTAEIIQSPRFGRPFVEGSGQL